MFAATSVAPGRLPPGAGRLHAVGWATVELERAIAQLAGVLGVPETAFVDAAGSAALGAHCRIAREPVIDGLRLAVLEPSTEGRLAATLARWDEGLVAPGGRDEHAPSTGAASGPRPGRSVRNGSSSAAR